MSPWWDMGTGPCYPPWEGAGLPTASPTSHTQQHDIFFRKDEVLTQFSPITGKQKQEASCRQGAPATPAAHRDESLLANNNWERKINTYIYAHVSIDAAGMKIPANAPSRGGQLSLLPRDQTRSCPQNCPKAGGLCGGEG